MNVKDVLHYGHLTVAGTLEGVPMEKWETAGVCGFWSVKQIIAHLASYEQVLVDVLGSLLGETGTPVLDRFKAGMEFNDLEVDARAGQSAQETWAEYEAAHAQSMDLIAKIPVETRHTNGVLPWYGAEYDLEDFITYMYYGHKREHAAQIAVYKDKLAEEAAA